MSPMQVVGAGNLSIEIKSTNTHNLIVCRGQGTENLPFALNKQEESIFFGLEMVFSISNLVSSTN